MAQLQICKQVKNNNNHNKLGDKLLINDLLYGLMLASGNDAAMTLAENFGVLIFLHQNGKLTNGKICLENFDN